VKFEGDGLVGPRVALSEQVHQLSVGLVQVAGRRSGRAVSGHLWSVLPRTDSDYQPGGLRRIPQLCAPEADGATPASSWDCAHAKDGTVNTSRAVRSSARCPAASPIAQHALCVHRPAGKGLEVADRAAAGDDDSAVHDVPAGPGVSCRNVTDMPG
jgi:hypothetical protein